jgi:alpha-beta hydrolase superfamily lysophospholipase
VQTDEFHYRSSDNLNLYARIWAPDSNPKGVVVLIHGLGEYGGRYEGVGRRFVDRGYVFIAGDLRGHGLSEGRRAFVSRLDMFMDDLDRYLSEVRSRFPNLPVFTYGFSMGSSLSAAWLIRRKPKLSGAVLCSGGFLMPDASKAMINKVRALNLVAPTMIVSNGMGPVRNKVCHDVSVLDAYDADPLVYKKVTIGLAVAIAEANRDALTRAAEVHVPVLVMHGADDIIAPPEGSRQFASGVSGDVTLKLWPGLYHFIHHEPDGAKEQVIDFAADWLDARTSG